MTANALQGDREKCIACGMNDYIAKPIIPDELWKALLTWVKPRVTVGRNILPMASGSDGRIQVLYDISGLDVAGGLQRLLGRTPIYLSMLRLFVSGNRECAAHLRTALETGDRATAERLIHTLKGVAGSIGATYLQTASTAVEEMIKSGASAEQARSHIDELEAVLCGLIGQLESKLPLIEPENSAAGSCDLNQLNPVCSRLLKLLDENDSEALDVVEEHTSLLYAAFKEQFQAIEGDIRSFEFDRALSNLRTAMLQAGLAP